MIIRCKIIFRVMVIVSQDGTCANHENSWLQRLISRSDGIPKVLVSVLVLVTLGKITTVQILVSEDLLQNGNKHQIMNVHTKWSGLIPILSILIKHFLFLELNC